MKMSYSQSANQALEIAREQAQAFHHRLVGSEHVLLALVIESEGDAGKLLRSWGLTPAAVREEIERYTGYGSAAPASYIELSPRLSVVLDYARRLASRSGDTEIKTSHVLLALVASDKILAVAVMKNLNVNTDRLQMALEDSLMQHNPETDFADSADWLAPDQAASATAQPKSGTPSLDKVAINLNQRVQKGEIDPVIGRRPEIARVIQILSRRTKNNPVLVGEPGVGKTAVAEAIAMAIVQKQVPQGLLHKRVMALDMSSLVAGTKYRGEFEERMTKILAEITQSGDIILFVDEMHTLIGAGSAEGAIDASNILKPSLARGDLQMIGATTFDEYQKYIERDAALARRFQQVKLDEPSKEAALEVLRGLRPKYEAYHQVSITDDSLVAAVDLSTRYIADRFLPDKAIDLVDEASAAVKIKHNIRVNPRLEQMNQQIQKLMKQKNTAAASQNFVEAAQLQERQNGLQLQREKLTKKLANSAKNRAVVGVNDIAQVVSEWTGVPVTQMAQVESRRLLHLEDELHHRVIGQNKAVSAVARAIRRSRSGIKDEQRPIGSFLFLGPTGVGKTELAKAVAASFFGSPANLIRIDMSEYMDQIASTKMIGSAPGYVGYEEGGQLSEQVRRHPYSVVLLDEVEKAHPDVFNLLLQVLDDGFLTDAKGRQVNFRNTIVIMTSNLGSHRVFDDNALGFNANAAEAEKTHRINMIKEATKRFFRPEFLNRIDETIIFDELTKKQLRQIVGLLTAKLTKRLARQGIILKLSPAALDQLVKAGYDPENGARPLRRAIQTKLEDRIAEMLIERQIVKGSTLKVGASHGDLKFTVQTATPVK